MLADIMNVAIEELVRNRFELPGFTTLLKEARRGRTEVNRGLYRCVAHALGDAGRAPIHGKARAVRSLPGARVPRATSRLAVL